MGYKDDGTHYTLEDLKGGNDTQMAKAAVVCRQTEENDFYFLDKSTIALFYFDHRISFGTRSELKHVLDSRKLTEVLMIRNKSRVDIHPWIYHRWYKALQDGYIKEYHNLQEVKEFLKKERGFK